jgi:hypothetical protein
VGQFGAARDTAQYEVNAAVLLYDVRYRFSERGEVFLRGSYSDTDAMFQRLNVVPNEPDVINAYFPNGELPGEGDDGTSPLRFHDYQGLAEINEYSDIDFEEFRARLGVDYVVLTGIKLYASYTYYDVKDNAPYLQDLAGTVSMGRLGAIWSF